ncbi:carboxymuconolactone decarboxylase family protein [Bradyrhizobium sp. 48]|uniref:carboxymuconolactone decarboxylase family protein n=1 Tax=Bradyrhizobium sp. 48 TaxID=2782676 RepID=UPI001FFBFE37|nr:carboxymuconolactone decarboxylase family protein [Bradyrhizobium sp. 48]
MIDPADFNPFQQALYDDMRAGIATGFSAFKTSDDNGKMIGPWNVSLHHPAVGKGSWELTKAVNAIGALPANVKEVAILVVGGHYRAAYEIYAHVAVAERVGMPLARISALVSNIKPADLAADESAAFDMVLALCGGGPVPEPIWRLAVETLGDLGAAQLVFLVGVYAFVATTLNGFDVPAPSRETGA